MVQIQGVYTQALFNFLLNSKSTIALSGPQSGIPPTILSPVAFQGAALKTLKVKHGKVHQYQAGKSQVLSTLEVTGPLLPTNIVYLCELFKQTQQGDFNMICNVQDSTIPFNAAQSDNVKDDDDERTHKLSQCGLSKESIVNFIEGSNHGKYAIRELKCENNMYSWNL
ncbi:protein downstream neighbor of Son-like [Glandiceps talaboti]